LKVKSLWNSANCKLTTESPLRPR